MQIARQIWPDSILLQPPAHLQAQQNQESKDILNTAAVQTLIATKRPQDNAEDIKPAVESKRRNFMTMLKKITKKIVGFG